MKGKIFLLLLITVGLVVSTVALVSAGGTLVFGIPGDMEKLDPGDAVNFQASYNIMENLVEFKPGTTEIQPCLATSWKVSKDGKKMTFHLRHGVKFHDGTDFNADAVVFSYARQYDLNHPYNQYGQWAYWKHAAVDIDKVVKIDDYTVEVILKGVNASIMRTMAMPFLGILSPTNTEKYKENTFKHPCGTGPFKFVEWVKDDHITLEANDNYWRERAKLDRVIYKVIPDPSARLMALEVNEIQGMEFPDPVSFDKIKANPDLQLITQPGMNIGFIAMNTGYGYEDANENGVHDTDEPWIKTPGYFEPLTKKKVRQAINYAIDKKSIIDNIYKGTAIVAKNGMPPFMLGYNDEVEDYPYDPKRAKELLAEAGYPNGFEVTLWVMPVSRPYMFDPPEIAEAVQSYLAVVGITAKLHQAEWGTYLWETFAGKHQMCFLGWTGDNGDPDNFLNVLYNPDNAAIGTASNRAFYNNEEVQDLLDKAVRTYDEKERAEYYKKVQKIIHEDAPWVYIAHARQNVALRSNVRGFTMFPNSKRLFYPMWIE